MNALSPIIGKHLNITQKDGSVREAVVQSVGSDDGGPFLVLRYIDERLPFVFHIGYTGEDSDAET
jgi:hypothetical protein